LKFSKNIKKEEIEKEKLFLIKRKTYSMEELCSFSSYISFKEKLYSQKTKKEIKELLKNKNNYIVLYIFELYLELLKNPNKKNIDKFRKTISFTSIRKEFVRKLSNGYGDNNHRETLFLIKKDKPNQIGDFLFPIILELSENLKIKLIDMDYTGKILKGFIEYLSKIIITKIVKTESFERGEFNKDLFGDIINATYKSGNNTRKIYFFEENTRYDYIEREELSEYEFYDFDNKNKIEYVVNKFKNKYSEKTLNKYREIDRVYLSVLDEITLKTIEEINNRINQKNQKNKYILNIGSNPFLKEVNKQQIEELMKNATSTSIQQIIKMNRYHTKKEDMAFLLEEIYINMKKNKIKPTKTLQNYYYDLLTSNIENLTFFYLFNTNFTKYVLKTNQINIETIYRKKTISNFINLLLKYYFLPKKTKKIKTSIIEHFIYQEKRDQNTRDYNYVEYIIQNIDTYILSDLKYIMKKSVDINLLNDFIKNNESLIMEIKEEIKKKENKEILVF